MLWLWAGSAKAASRKVAAIFILNPSDAPVSRMLRPRTLHYTEDLSRSWLIFPLLLLYLLHLGGVGFLGPDEPRYASIGREMARSGDWITPAPGRPTVVRKTAADLLADRGSGTWRDCPTNGRRGFPKR